MVVLVATAGVIFEHIGRRHDRHAYPQVGTSHDIGGRSLNLFCSGRGSPTVVFGTFAHQSGYEWVAVQPDVARFTRACWYDRAGYGWSDPGPLYPTATDVAEDLHALLQTAREPPPYVVVGNGDVTLHTRVFHGRYPGELGGAVFVGGNDVDEAPPPPPSGQAKLQQLFGSVVFRAVRWIRCPLVPAMARVGLLRAFPGSLRRTNRYDLSEEQEIAHAFLSDNPTAYRYTETAQCVQEDSRAQARLTRNLGNLPLIVLTQAASPSDDPALTREMHAFRSRLAALSSRGHLEVVSGRIGRDVIAKAIKRVVEDGRLSR